MKEYEENLLNKAISDNLFSYKNRVIWIFKGQEQRVESHRDFNKLLSRVCDEIYHETPEMHNELFNKHKLSGTITAARKSYLTYLIEHSNEENLGFPEDKFPPEKTIYFSLLKNTGLHENCEPMEQRAQSQVYLDSAESRQRKSEAQFADAPTNKGALPLRFSVNHFKNFSVIST